MQANIRTRTLEITVISGENLYVDGNPVGESAAASVVVRTESLKCWSTKTAAKGGLGYPLWDEKLVVEMPLHARSITLEVQCRTSKGGSSDSSSSVRSIGVARIGVWDILGGEGEGEGKGTLQKEGWLHVMSYRLRNWEGRRNGVLNFSARVVKKKEEEEEEEEEKNNMMDHHHHHEMKGLNDNNDGGVVLGVPVWWNNHLGIHV